MKTPWGSKNYTAYVLRFLLKEARYIELKIKNFKRRDYIEKILKDGYIKLTPL
jgi:hypothetical protein